MRPRSAWAAGLVCLSAAALLGAVGHGALGCSGRTGTFCQQQGDCSAGLLCVKPAPSGDGGAADMGVFGVCQPALRGRGETCLYSTECEASLFCSNEIGLFTGDDRHGTCQLIERPHDGGDRDLATDAAPPGDLGPGDGGDGGG